MCEPSSSEPNMSATAKDSSECGLRQGGNQSQPLPTSHLYCASAVISGALHPLSQLSLHASHLCTTKGRQITSVTTGV